MKAIVAVVLMLCMTGLWGIDLQPPMPQYRESSGFGPRQERMGGSLDAFHWARDLVAPEGTPVNAAAAGTVVQVWPPPDGYFKGHPVYGGMVLLKHDEATYTLYGHLSRVTVQEGWFVWAGRQIGVIGNTGLSTGTHLHFEIMVRPDIPSVVEPVKVDPIEKMVEHYRRAYLAAKEERWNVVP